MRGFDRNFFNGAITIACTVLSNYFYVFAFTIPLQLISVAHAQRKAVEHAMPPPTYKLKPRNRTKAPKPAPAKPAPPIAPAATAPTTTGIYALVVDGVAQGDIQVRLRGADVLAPVARLQEVGIDVSQRPQETIEGAAYIPLPSLAPAMTYAIDTQELILRLDNQARLGQTALLDLQSRPPPNIEYSRPLSSFLNYAVQARNFNAFDGFGEFGASWHGHLLLSDFRMRYDGKFIRGLSSLTFDDRPGMRRVVVGDSFSQTGLLGGGLFIGGVKLTRQFSLNPYFIRFPSFGMSGAVSTQSQAQVYVNGRLVGTQNIQPGAFELQNIPMINGAGTTEVVLKDVYGRQQVVASPYYFSTGVLKPGLNEYSYGAGARRYNVGVESFDYGRPVVQGLHRLGLTNWLTGGLQAELSQDLAQGGAMVTTRTMFGEIEAAIAGSYEMQGASGVAGSLGYSYLSRHFSAGGLARAQSNHYANLTLPSWANRSLLEGTVFVAKPIGNRVSLTLQYTGAAYRDSPRRDRVGLLGNIRIADYTNLTANVAYQRFDVQNQFEAFVMLTQHLGGNTTASLAHNQQGSRMRESAQIQKPLGLGEGYGYRATVEGGDVFHAEALGQYQTEFGRYEVAYDRLGSQNNVMATASGALVLIGGGLFATRPMSDSFALLQVPDVKGVRGYLNHQPVGATDSDGDLLIPFLLPYYGNRISIADEDIPLTRSIDRTERIVAPPYRGGALARFAARPVQGVTGFIQMLRDGTAITPAYGQLIVDLGDKVMESPLGERGQFYLESIPTGVSLPARVEHEDATCEFTMMVRASKSAANFLINVGVQKCTAKPAAVVPQPGPAVAAPDPTPPSPAPAKGRRGQTTKPANGANRR